MEIKRIHFYKDQRFSDKVLLSHECFLVDDIPYEVEIISDFEAIIRGAKREWYVKVIEEFRFYTPHITRFIDDCGHVIKEYPKVPLLTLFWIRFSHLNFMWMKISSLQSVLLFINRRISSSR